MPKLLLDFDDYHWRYPENCLESVLWLREQIPGVRICLFTIPRLGGLSLSQAPNWCLSTRELVLSGTVELGVHGLTHTQEEFGWASKETATDMLLQAELEFQLAGLPFLKIFKAPNWSISRGTYEALVDLGYRAVFSHEKFRTLGNEFGNIQSVYYNWNLMDTVPPTSDYLLGHGHTHDVCGNGIAQVASRLVIASKNCEFLSVQQFLATNSCG